MIKFDIDKQTINDLELFEKTKDEKSIFGFFNFTKSLGGKKKLENIFYNPLTDIALIEKRKNIIKHFQINEIAFDIDKEWLDFAEFYLVQQNKPTRLSLINIWRRAIKNKIKPNNDYYVVQRGIRYLIAVVNGLYEFAKEIPLENCPDLLLNYQQTVIDIVEKTTVKKVLILKHRKKLFPVQYGRLDFSFRYVETEHIKTLLEIIYNIDVFKSVAYASFKNGFTYPVFLDNTQNTLKIEGLYHPFLTEPVHNKIEFRPDQNLCFLTGPNMAGKSTFMKSLGIAVYLSHLGFPVPASYMETSVFNGLLTTISLADNLNKGYSHFYNEVLRIKHVAERINEMKNIVVIFDELFRGTNVKDAYEASLSVISAFAKINRSIFAISTHIIEVADKLQHYDSINFKYFEIKMNNGNPQYTYNLKDGVTDERIGMYILNKERVIETIENVMNNDE